MSVFGLLAGCAVVLVGAGDAFSERVRGELTSSLSCLDVAAVAEPDDRRMVVRLFSRRHAEVWEHGALVRTFDLDAGDAVDAVKLAEHVRARSLAEPPTPAKDAPRTEAPVQVRAPAPAPRNVEPDASHAATEPSDLRFAVAAGMGPTVEAGQPGVAARFALRTRVTGKLGAGALLVVPVLPARLAEASGEATIETVAFGPTADLELRPSERSPLSVSVGVAGLFAITRSAGTATGTYVGRTDAQSRFVPAATAGIAVAMSKRVALDLGGALGMALPATEVRFANSNVGRWGAPYVFTSAGLRILF
jgi:hypothetical protein